MASLIHRLADWYDHSLCKLGIRRAATFSDVLARPERRLYAGRISRGLQQYGTSVGMTPYFPNSHNIDHDVTAPLPIPDNSIAIYQSEDVFEHVPEDTLVAMFDEIYRVLEPGGLFRLSLPDYRFDIYRDRSARGVDGEIVFDPGGGGAFEAGKIVDGGHLWFPTYEKVKALFEQSRFTTGGSVGFLHYTRADGVSVLEEIDYSLGHVIRTPDHDARARSPRRALSIVVDARKI